MAGSLLPWNSLAKVATQFGKIQSLAQLPFSNIIRLLKRLPPRHQIVWLHSLVIKRFLYAEAYI
jgi:hypothetical protein